MLVLDDVFDNWFNKVLLVQFLDLYLYALGVQAWQ